MFDFQYYADNHWDQRLIHDAADIFQSVFLVVFVCHL